MTCPFCNLAKGNKIIFETKNFIFFSDKNPIVEGHALLIPKKHIRSEYEIPLENQMEYMEATLKAHEYIKNKFDKDALTFINATQDQSVTHFHKHFLPGVFGSLGVDNALRDFLSRLKA